MSRARLARGLIALAGAAYMLTGLAQLFAPQWFFDNVGNFPPFNRHYVGDLGAFTLALGVGMLAAARDPVRHRLLIGVAALGSVVHALNHVYDDWLSADLTAAHLLSQTLPLALIALALALVWGDLGRHGQREVGDEGRRFEAEV